MIEQTQVNYAAWSGFDYSMHLKPENKDSTFYITSRHKDYYIFFIAMNNVTKFVPPGEYRDTKWLSKFFFQKNLVETFPEWDRHDISQEPGESPPSENRGDSMTEYNSNPVATVVDDKYFQELSAAWKGPVVPTLHQYDAPAQKIVRKHIIKPKKVFTSPSQCVTEFFEPVREKLEMGEVLLRVEYAPVNLFDVYKISYGEDILQSYATRNTSAGCSRVEDVAGRLSERLGPGVNDLIIGDCVIPISDCVGTWQSVMICRERDLLRIPPNVLPLKYCSIAKELFLGYFLIQRFGASLRPSDSVILNAGNSLVSQVIIQLCKLLDLQTIVVIRRHGEINQYNRVCQYLRGLGATAVYCDTDPITHYLEQDGIKYPKLALDSVQGKNASSALVNCMQSGGKIVVYGGTSRENFQLPWHVIVCHAVTIHGFYLEHWFQQTANHKIFLRALGNIGQLIKHDELKLLLEIYPFEHYKTAIEYACTQGRLSKPILVPLSLHEQSEVLHRGNGQMMDTHKHGKYEIHCYLLNRMIFLHALDYGLH
ncbi:DnaJ domain-containing protein [Cardiosporidium cionae]|uniref:DnaJ domain-containing protein n=1 Tax=Cardiosporidium cionae TaxID=476202 RepID=A0ABQ7J5F9_9APIC|nr:DnaJ domain-containing protein [Cardiosporidium cionae]|eukprot:KAF8819217.1 DnaJ domain-containing protein [Cardiosporidium cionae]